MVAHIQCEPHEHYKQTLSTQFPWFICRLALYRGIWITENFSYVWQFPVKIFKYKFYAEGFFSEWSPRMVHQASAPNLKLVPTMYMYDVYDLFVV